MEEHANTFVRAFAAFLFTFHKFVFVKLSCTFYLLLPSSFNIQSLMCKGKKQRRTGITREWRLVNIARVFIPTLSSQLVFWFPGKTGRLLDTLIVSRVDIGI